MREPAQLATHIEQRPELPPGDDERFAGYGVMGLPFKSGHVLGLRRWPASSVGEPFTSVWHRDPGGRWTFYQTATPDVGCTRYFGADVERIRTGPIELDWQDERTLYVRTTETEALDWSVHLGSSVVTRTMNAVGSSMPDAMWRSGVVLSTMGKFAGVALRAGRVQLTGTVPNGHHFDANPLLIWYVTSSTATVEGEDLGPTGPLAEQAHLRDFYIPQRGIFAIARAYLEPATVDSPPSPTGHAR